MRRFLAYEEYGAKYEMMVRDVASTYKSIPTWHAYERGIETLANSLSVVNKDGSPRRKGLTFEDLVIKVWAHEGLPMAFVLSTPRR